MWPTAYSTGYAHFMGGSRKLTKSEWDDFTWGVYGNYASYCQGWSDAQDVAANMPCGTDSRLDQALAEA